MQTVFKLVLCLSLISLAACSGSSDSTPAGNNSLGSPAEEISSESLKGTMNGTAWAMGQAIGKVQADGMLMVSISGSNEVINCQYNTPLQAGVLFSVPLAVGEHNFDMLRPDVGYAVTWTYPTNDDSMNIVSDMAKIKITSIGNNRAAAGLSAKFLNPSSPGKLNGSFEITLCP